MGVVCDSLVKLRCASLELGEVYWSTIDPITTVRFRLCLWAEVDAGRRLA